MRREERRQEKQEEKDKKTKKEKNTRSSGVSYGAKTYHDEYIDNLLYRNPTVLRCYSFTVSQMTQVSQASQVLAVWRMSLFKVYKVN